MAPKRARVVIRIVHYWTTIAVILTGGLIAVTGTLLVLKKDFDWLQAPMERASAQGLSDVKVSALVDAAGRSAGRPLRGEDIDRIDVRPSDGIAKVITNDHEEFQVDIFNLEVLSTSYRTADVIETIHDGSFFGKSAKYFAILPAGIALMILWITGLVLFSITLKGKFKARRKRR